MLLSIPHKWESYTNTGDLDSFVISVEEEPVFHAGELRNLRRNYH